MNPTYLLLLILVGCTTAPSTNSSGLEWDELRHVIITGESWETNWSK